jgi:hypothetical protein
MLPLLAVSALASGASAAFQFINGLKQQRQAASMYVPPRPTYTIPGEVSQATARAQSLANGPMAGFGQALAKVGANTASTVRAAQESGSPSNALAVIAAAGDSQNNATSNLYQQNAQFQRQGAAALISQLGTQAQYADKAWDYNKRKPYEEAAAAKSALTQAGATNVNSGLAGLGSAITQGARGFMGGADASGVSGLFGGNKSQAGPYQMQYPSGGWPYGNANAA